MQKKTEALYLQCIPHSGLCQQKTNVIRGESAPIVCKRQEELVVLAFQLFPLFFTTAAGWRALTVVGMGVRIDAASCQIFLFMSIE
ncbi:MAG: hypothetical protein C4532_05670 [Candidatus Abyssobacteria bacterium SURF_17]|uniref:Uncharacterized protein n=1 Tax=Candidatus Abyssobacteria bacterium SURF_17 TaxID=2093361 RepID=A0A419F2K1_9BACT|nr:MAG: hypothetical protein C4532_05670 [Candidatus Abyssubacteria bacterium SURF_17]